MAQLVKGLWISVQSPEPTFVNPGLVNYICYLSAGELPGWIPRVHWSDCMY